VRRATKDIINSTMNKKILILLLALVAVHSMSLSHMTAQEPLPQPTLTVSEGWGADAPATPFTQLTRFPEFLEVRAVVVTVGTYGWAWGFQPSYGTSDGKIFYKAPKCGVTVAGTDSTFVVPVGEYIKEVKYTRVNRYGYYGESLEFVTDKGTRKHFGASNGDKSHSFIVPNGHRLVGFKGNSGQFLDYLQIITSPRY
jgi:hypothetical protein